MFPSAALWASRLINEIGTLEVQTEQHPKGLEMIGIAKETICERCLKDLF